MNIRKALQTLALIALLIVPVAVSAHEGHSHDDTSMSSVQSSITPSPSASPSTSPAALAEATGETQNDPVPVATLAVIVLAVIGGAAYFVMRKR